MVVADVPALRDFARRTWPERDPTFLERRWWLRATPAECHVAVEGGEIHGICGGRRQRVWLGDRVGAAVGICDWYVGEKARGARVGRALAEEALRGADLGWSLSLSAAAETAFHRLGWSPDPAARVPLFVGATPIVAFAGRRGARVDHRPLAVEDVARAPGRRAQGMRDADAWRAHLALVPHRTYDLHVLGETYAVSRRLPMGAFPRLGPQRITLISELSGIAGVPRVLSAVAAHAMRHGSTVMVLPLLDLDVQEQVARVGLWSAAAGYGGVRLPRLGTRFMWRGAAPAEWRVSALDCDFDLTFGADRGER